MITLTKKTFLEIKSLLRANCHCRQTEEHGLLSHGELSKFRMVNFKRGCHYLTSVPTDVDFYNQRNVIILSFELAPDPEGRSGVPPLVKVLYGSSTLNTNSRDIYYYKIEEARKVWRKLVERYQFEIPRFGNS
jgi:hypothetical protein